MVLQKKKEWVCYPTVTSRLNVVRNFEKLVTFVIYFGRIGQKKNRFHDGCTRFIYEIPTKY